MLLLTTHAITACVGAVDFLLRRHSELKQITVPYFSKRFFPRELRSQSVLYVLLLLNRVTILYSPVQLCTNQSLVIFVRLLLTKRFIVYSLFQYHSSLIIEVFSPTQKQPSPHVISSLMGMLTKKKCCHQQVPCSLPSMQCPKTV